MTKEIRCPAKFENSTYSVEGGNCEIAMCGFESGCGFWISRKDGLTGVAIYDIQDQIAIGVRRGTNLLNCIAVDGDGAGFIQLVDAKEQSVFIDATQLRKLLKLIK